MINQHIGICGHRGAGKNTISYLLANMIDYILYHKPLDDLHDNFNRWCKEIYENESIIYEKEFQRVSIESFSNDIKSYIYCLIGIPMEFMNDDKCKDGIVINMKNFEYDHKTNVDKSKIMSRKEFFEKRDIKSITPINSDVYLTLRDFILYFGQDVMQRFFGVNVWVKSMKVNKQKWDCNWIDDLYKIYTIFSDVKTQCEYEYIKSLNGIIIKVSRLNHYKKESSLGKLENSTFDYEIVINDDMFNDIDKLQQDIYNIANQIIQNNGQSKC